MNVNAIYTKPVLFSVAALIAILVGTVATMFYPMLREDMHPRLAALRAFTPLELAGRDIYQREGCMGCHTQTVRPLASEVARYGDYSKAGELAYDRPHLWGSKRTWRARGACGRTTGTRATSRPRGRWCRSRTCPPTPSSRARSSTHEA